MTVEKTVIWCLSAEKQVAKRFIAATNIRPLGMRYRIIVKISSRNPCSNHPETGPSKMRFSRNSRRPQALVSLAVRSRRGLENLADLLAVKGFSPTHSHIKQRFSRKKLMAAICDGAFAPESWVRSCLQHVEPTDRRASRPYHFFRFARICAIRGPAPKRQRTAVATMLPSPCPCASVRAPVFT